MHEVRHASCKNNSFYKVHNSYEQGVKIWQKQKVVSLIIWYSGEGSEGALIRNPFSYDRPRGRRK